MTPKWWKMHMRRERWANRLARWAEELMPIPGYQLRWHRWTPYGRTEHDAHGIAYGFMEAEHLKRQSVRQGRAVCDLED